jgi:transcriptional regulator GlxA family with amidase domain
MTLGILVFPQVEELDFVGPWEMATMWQQLAGGPKCLVVAEHVAPITCAKGLSINPHVSFEECPPLEYLMVPGGQGTRTEVNNVALLDFVATQAKTCRAVLSVCTGSFVLHAAGLLAGKRATTHWASLDRLRALGDVDVVEERFVRDGNIWSSAGVSAGIDLTLAFIAEVAGEETAAKVQFASEYYPSDKRYGALHNTHPSAPAYARDA